MDLILAFLSVYHLCLFMFFIRFLTYKMEQNIFWIWFKSERMHWRKTAAGELNTVLNQTACECTYVLCKLVFVRLFSGDFEGRKLWKLWKCSAAADDSALRWNAHEVGNLNNVLVDQKFNSGALRGAQVLVYVLFRTIHMRMRTCTCM